MKETKMKKEKAKEERNIEKDKARRFFENGWMKKRDKTKYGSLKG